MAHDSVSIDPAGMKLVGPSPPGRADPPTTSALLGIAFGIVAIAALALLFCCLIGIAAVLALYWRGGADGVVDFYQELRFDVPLRTQLGAAFVSVLYVGVAIATLATTAWREGRRWMRRLALIRARWLRPPALLIFFATLAYAAVATLTMSLMRGTHVIISGPTDVVLLGTIAVNLVLLAPVAEELFFRGWLYTGLRNRLAFWPSFLLTASLFAAIHWDSTHRRILLVLPLAIALGVLREITGSIKPTIALHGLYNLIIVGITLLEA